MPRGFSDSEKTTIRAQLMEQGQAYLSSVGLRKTSVEDLTTAVGISKGSFYLFFPSKEALFFAIFETWEAEYQDQLLALASDAGGTAAERLRRFFQQAFSLWRTSPLFQHFGRDDYAALIRTLPPEQLAAHLRSDEDFAERLLARWRESGIRLPYTAQQWTGLMRALFFVSLHANEIGTAYPWTIDMLTTLLAEQLGTSAGPGQRKRT